MISTARLRRPRTTEPLRVAMMTVALLLACALPPAVHARQSDRSKPIKISANHFDALATPNGVSHLKGDVVIIQGTLKVTGASATIHFDANRKVKRVVLTGAPAHLRQIDDHGNLLKARADRIDYNIPKGIATLTGHACVDQVGRGTACGAKLVYNTATSAMSGSSHGHHRVHLTFQPRQSTSSAKPQPAPASSTGGH